jgi:hypothetical protein
MRRTELEQRLRELGREPTNETSGANHDVWRHPSRRRAIYVRRVDFINDHTASRILDGAEEVESR